MRKGELLTWRGTPGVGDFMWALNCAHNYAFYYDKVVTLEFQWEHDEDYLHHFEEEETIIERLHYIHNFYYRKDDVKVTHVFNAKGRYRDRPYFEDMVMQPDGRLRQRPNFKPKKRFWFESGTYKDDPGGSIPPNFWTFRFDMNEVRSKWINNKVVVWTPLENAEIPKTWKNFLTYDEWRGIIQVLRRSGLNVVELTYRTPIREAMYHISTCRMVFCYDGMWHYIAKNLQTPMVVVSTEGITSYHTEHAVKLSPRKELETESKPYVMDYIKHIPEMLGETKLKSGAYYREFIKDIFFNE